MKIIFFSLFTLFSISASAANWVEVARNVKETEIYYLNTQEVQRGYKRWILKDIPYGDESGNRSYLIYWEADCKDARTRILAANSYSENMAKGNLDNVNEAQVWRYVTPDSISETIFKYICRTK